MFVSLVLLSCEKIHQWWWVCCNGLDCGYSQCKYQLVCCVSASC